MDARTLIANHRSIYEQYELIPLLRAHMERVAAIALCIIEHWSGPRVDRDLIVATCLMHDLGNIAKSDLNKPLDKTISERLDYWKAVQQRVVSRYGNTDEQATANMLRELEAPEELQAIVNYSAYRYNEQTLATGSWEAKIYKYADMRAAPFRVVTLPERMQDAKQRYAGKYDGLSEQAQSLDSAAFEIEKQIAEHLSISVDEITEERIQSYLQQL